MIKFKKAFRYKSIIVLFTSGIFLITSVAYGIGISSETHLRKSLDFSSEQEDLSTRYYCIMLATKIQRQILEIRENISHRKLGVRVMEDLRTLFEEYSQRNVHADIDDTNNIWVYHEPDESDQIATYIKVYTAEGKTLGEFEPKSRKDFDTEFDALVMMPEQIEARLREIGESRQARRIEDERDDPIVRMTPPDKYPLSNDTYVQTDMGYTEPQEGAWKIHITSDEQSIEQLVELVLPWLFEKGINHKIVKNLEKLKKQNEDPLEQGKIITIYFASQEDAVQTAIELDRLLFGRDLTGPLVPTNMAFGKSGLVSYRFAAVKEKKRIFRIPGKPDYKYVMKFPYVPMLWVEDPVRKGKAVYKPWWMEDPFKDVIYKFSDAVSDRDIKNKAMLNLAKVSENVDILNLFNGNAPRGQRSIDESKFRAELPPIVHYAVDMAIDKNGIIEEIGPIDSLSKRRKIRKGESILVRVTRMAKSGEQPYSYEISYIKSTPNTLQEKVMAETGRLINECAQRYMPLVDVAREIFKNI